MNVFICPIDWTHWREQFIPEQIVSLLDHPGLASGLRPPWIPEQNHKIAYFRDHEDPTLPEAPTEGQVAELIDWLKERVGPDFNCLIHCTAGLGRSPAIGYIAWALHYGPGREVEAFRKMVESCQQTKLTPNRLIIDLADKLLGSNGKLIAPLRAWNRRVLWARSHW